MAIIEEIDDDGPEELPQVQQHAQQQPRAGGGGSDSDSDSDDDAPPDLSSSVEQLAALKLKAQRAGGGGGSSAASGGGGGSSEGGINSESASAASARAVAPAPVPAAKAVKKGVRRGFFDAKPARKRAPASGSGTAAEPTTVRAAPGASADSLRSGKQVPDFMKLPPDEKERQATAFKKQLTEALKPTPDLLKGIQADKGLLGAFDDPEVMKAVDEIASKCAQLSACADARAGTGTHAHTHLHRRRRRHARAHSHSLARTWARAHLVPRAARIQRCARTVGASALASARVTLC